MEPKSAIFLNRNNLFYEILYYYSCLWHVIAHFGKMLFMRSYIIKTKFCASVFKSVCVHTHAQRKKPAVSKFGTEILERVLRRPRSDFFLIDVDFLKWFKKIFSWICASYSFISGFFASLRGTRRIQMKI